MHAAPASNRYRPRSSRAGVRSNLTSVSGRAAGPMNGRHPTVAVIADASNTSTPNATHAPTRRRIAISHSRLLTSCRAPLLYDTRVKRGAECLGVVDKQDCGRCTGSTAPAWVDTARRLGSLRPSRVAARRDVTAAKPDPPLALTTTPPARYARPHCVTATATHAAVMHRQRRPVPPHTLARALHCCRAYATPRASRVSRPHRHHTGLPHARLQQPPPLGTTRDLSPAPRSVCHTGPSAHEAGRA